MGSGNFADFFGRRPVGMRAGMGAIGDDLGNGVSLNLPPASPSPYSVGVAAFGKSLSNDRANVYAATIKTPVAADTVVPVSKGPVDACGGQPARVVNGAGLARYSDAAAGAQWDACQAAKASASEKAAYDAVVGRRAGGPDGCGPEPLSFTAPDGSKHYVGTGSQWTGDPLGAAWASCRAPAAAAPSPLPVQVVPATYTPPGAIPSSSSPSSVVAPGASAAIVASGGTQQAPAPVVQQAPAGASTGTIIAVGGGALALGVVAFLLLR